jgi:hypothetical protein
MWILPFIQTSPFWSKLQIQLSLLNLVAGSTAHGSDPGCVQASFKKLFVVYSRR